jgi:hypothetical protein
MRRIFKSRTIGRVSHVGMAEAAVAVLLSCWLYVAVIAAFWPARLSSHVATVIPLRWDTLGIVCFVTSACIHLGAGLVRHRGTALLSTAFLYSTLMVIYLLTNLIIHPRTMTKPLTHLAAWPSEGQTLLLACLLWGAALVTVCQRSRRAGTER